MIRKVQPTMSTPNNGSLQLSGRLSHRVQMPSRNSRQVKHGFVHPMCLREVGKRLNAAAKECATFDDSDKASTFVESTVARFARNVRLITQNCSCYPSAGATVIAAGNELLRIFELLLLDWVLSPRRGILPSIEDLDDFAMHAKANIIWGD
jgi:hypothetical protein